MKRTNVEFSDGAAAALDRLTRELGTSQVGVLRFGLHLLEIAVREQRAGNALGVIRGERVVKEISGVWAPTTA